MDRNYHWRDHWYCDGPSGGMYLLRHCDWISD